MSYLDIYIAVAVTVILIIMWINSIGQRSDSSLIDEYEDMLAIKDNALETAAKWFEGYAKNHYDKDTPSSTEKGIVNDERAAFCRAAAEE